MGEVIASDTIGRSAPRCRTAYDSALSGIAVHAGFAAVNGNFWITPGEANLGPDSGGMII